MLNIQQYPSIVQDHAHSSLTEKYKFVPTTQLISDLSKQGWQLQSVQEKKVRLSTRQGFQKHLLRFRHSDYNLELRDRLFPEIVVTNSHDGSSTFQLMAGIFRIVCSNGLIVATSKFGDYHIKHVGYTADKVAEATHNILQTVPRIATRITEFDTIEMSKDERGVYASAAIQFKYGKTEGYNVDALLHAHREADQKPSLWNTYNILQENLIKGGEYRLRRRGAGFADAAGVKSIDRNVSINKALWSMAEKMADLKVEGITITNN